MVGGLIWRDEFLKDNPVSVEKSDQHWLHIAFTCFAFFGWGVLRFRFIPINPTFITSYDLGKEVWVDPDLLLKFRAALQPMLLLIVTQQPGHEFCRNLPHVEFIGQSAVACPYDSSTLLQTSWIICLWPLRITSHSCNIFWHCANWRLSRIFIIVNWHFPVFNLVKPVIGLLPTQNVITKCLLKHFVSFCCTVAKFEEKLDANTLFLHVHHFNVIYIKTIVTWHYKSA